MSEPKRKREYPISEILLVIGSCVGIWFAWQLIMGNMSITILIIGITDLIILICYLSNLLVPFFEAIEAMTPAGQKRALLESGKAIVCPECHGTGKGGEGHWTEVMDNNTQEMKPCWSPGGKCYLCWGSGIKFIGK